MRSILTRDSDSFHFLNHQKPEDLLQGADLELYESLLNEITWYLSEEMQGISVAELSFQAVDDRLIAIMATVNTPITLNPKLVGELQRHLQETIDSRIKITVKSEVGGTANAEGYTTL